MFLPKHSILNQGHLCSAFPTAQDHQAFASNHLNLLKRATFHGVHIRSRLISGQAKSFSPFASGTLSVIEH